MGYELSALVAAEDALQIEAFDAVALEQGFGLIPITEVVLDRLGGLDLMPFGETFWSLSAGVARLAGQISIRGAVAYLEAELFGGSGTQAAVVWDRGVIVLGPMWYDTDDASGAVPLRKRPFNVALERIGARPGAHVDAFEALGIGRHRHTDEWAR